MAFDFSGTQQVMSSVFVWLIIQSLNFFPLLTLYFPCRKEARIVVDGALKAEVKEPPGPVRALHLTSPLVLGASVDYRDGFVGCIRAMLLNGQLVDLKRFAQYGLYGEWSKLNYWVLLYFYMTSAYPLSNSHLLLCFRCEPGMYW